MRPTLSNLILSAKGFEFPVRFSYIGQCLAVRVISPVRDAGRNPDIENCVAEKSPATLAVLDVFSCTSGSILFYLLECPAPHVLPRCHVVIHNLNNRSSYPG